MKGLFSNKSSRSSSLASLNLDIFENEPVATAEQVDEITFPSDVEKIEDYQKEYTSKHPLGALLLQISAANIELCKKNGVSIEEIPSLKDVCSHFTKAIAFERNRNVSKLNKATYDIENSILNKELNFSNVNQAIAPPVHFSSVPTLDNPAKISEALKIFPTRANQKFCGFRYLWSNF